MASLIYSEEPLFTFRGPSCVHEFPLSKKENHREYIKNRKTFPVIFVFV